MWSIANQFSSRIVGKKSPALLVSVFLLGAGGLIATADNANRIVPPFQIFADPDGAFATLNLGGPTDTTTNPFFLSGLRQQRTPLCHLSSTQRRLVGHASTYPGALCGYVGDGSHIPTSGRRQLPVGGRLHAGRTSRSLQPIAEQGIISRWNRRSGKRRLPGDQRLQPLWMQRHRRHFDVPKAAADHEPSFLERGHV